MPRSHVSVRCVRYEEMERFHFINVIVNCITQRKCLASFQGLPKMKEWMFVDVHVHLSKGWAFHFQVLSIHLLVATSTSKLNMLKAEHNQSNQTRIIVGVEVTLNEGKASGWAKTCGNRSCRFLPAIFNSKKLFRCRAYFDHRQWWWNRSNFDQPPTDEPPASGLLERCKGWVRVCREKNRLIFYMKNRKL